MQNEIQTLVQQINDHKANEEQLAIDIKFEYTAIINTLTESGGTLNKSTDERYKTIDRLFKMKQEHIVYRENAIKKLHKLVGIM